MYLFQPSQSFLWAEILFDFTPARKVLGKKDNGACVEIMWWGTRRKGKKQDSPRREDKILQRYPNIDELFSKEPSVSPWHQLAHKQIFTTPSGRLTWGNHDDGLFLMGRDGEVVGIVRNGTIVKQLDHSRLLVSYETRYLDPWRRDPDNRNALHISIVRIDRLRSISDPESEISKMKEEHRQITFGDQVDEQCAIPLKVSEGLHTHAFPKTLKSIDEILHLSEYLPLNRPERQHISDALFIMRPKKDEYEVFPQDWYNFAGVDYLYMFPDKAVRDPISGRIFVHGVRMRDVVLDETYRNGEMR